MSTIPSSSSTSISSQFTYSNGSYFPTPFHLQQPQYAAPPQPPAVPVTVPSTQFQQAQQLFQKDAQTITPKALESVKAALATSDIEHKAETKKKAVPRKVAGQTWEDPTLAEWPEKIMSTKEPPPPLPKLMTLNKGLKLAEQWVKNMPGDEEEAGQPEVESRPSRLGLGAKVPRKSHVGPLNDPVERRLYKKLGFGRKKITGEEDSKPTPKSEVNDDDDDDENLDSRANAFAKKRAAPVTTTQQAKKKVISTSSLLNFLSPLFPSNTQSPTPKFPLFPSNSLSISISTPKKQEQNALISKKQEDYPSELMAVVCPSLAFSNTLYYKSAYNVQVLVDENEPEERLLNRFRREVMRAGVIQECKRRRFFENKQDEKKRKSREAAKRNSRRRRTQFRGPFQNREETGKVEKKEDDEDNWEMPEGDAPF